MKYPLLFSFLLFSSTFGLLFSACGGDTTADSDSATETEEPQSMIEDEPEASPFGVGPVQEEIVLPEEIDQDLVAKGKELYGQKCVACHNPERDLIGPSQKGVFERRNPTWVMNMILNPEEMVKKDPVAKKLFEKYNKVMMTNMNLTQDEARAIMEYIRTF